MSIEKALNHLAEQIVSAVREEMGLVDEGTVDAYIDIINVEDEVKERAHKLLRAMGI